MGAHTRTHPSSSRRSPQTLAVVIVTLGLVSISTQGCDPHDKSVTGKTLAEACSGFQVSNIFVDRNDVNCLCKAMENEFLKKGEPEVGSFDITQYHDVLLRHWPMIYSHDAGTGYQEDGACHSLTLKNNFAVTQSTGLVGQLECGARAFDIRTTPNPEGGLGFVHGEVGFFGTSVSTAFDEVISWANSNPSELIILITKARGGSAEALTTLLNDKGIRIVDCDFLHSKTLGEAKRTGQLTGGGSILAASHTCPISNYDVANVCHTATQSCYDNDADDLRTYFWNYVTRTLATEHTKMWMVQAHWQYTAESISAAISDAAAQTTPCLLNDEESTCQVLGMAAYIRNEEKPHGLNLVDVDHVCYSGRQLVKAIKEYVMSQSYKDAYVPSPR